MSFQYKFAPINDLFVPNRKLVKFMVQSLFGQGLIGAGFNEQGQWITVLTCLLGNCAICLCGTGCDPTCGLEPARRGGEDGGSQLLLSLLFSYCAVLSISTLIIRRRPPDTIQPIAL